MLYQLLEADDMMVICCSLIGMGVVLVRSYEGWNFNSGNYLFTTDTK